MQRAPYKQGTILIPSGPPNDRERLHLFVVCSDPCKEHMVVIVPICTCINNLCDQTCLIFAHDHAFIRHKSYVLYRNARMIGCNEVAEKIANLTFMTHDDMNAQTFLKVKNGICKSDHTPRKIKKYMNCPPSYLA